MKEFIDNFMAMGLEQQIVEGSLMALVIVIPVALLFMRVNIPVKTETQEMIEEAEKNLVEAKRDLDKSARPLMPLPVESDSNVVLVGENKKGIVQTAKNLFKY